MSERIYIGPFAAFGPDGRFFEEAKQQRDLVAQAEDSSATELVMGARRELAIGTFVELLRNTGATLLGETKDGTIYLLDTPLPGDAEEVK